MTAQPQTPNSQLAKIADLLQIQIDDATIMHTEILTALTALQDAISSLTAATAAQPAAIAAPATPAAAPANVRDFAADTLILSIDDNGKPAVQGARLPLLGIWHPNLARNAANSRHRRRQLKTRSQPAARWFNRSLASH